MYVKLVAANNLQFDNPQLYSAFIHDPGEFFLSFGTEADTALIDEALTGLEETLLKYPDNFFEGFKENDYKDGIIIYFNGTLEGISVGGITEAGAFTTEQGDYLVMVFDINDSLNLPVTICHEMSHSIYNKLVHDEWDTEGELFDEEYFATLNPEGFTYLDMYSDDEGRQYYELTDYDNTGAKYYEDYILDNVYFEGIYSKTFLTEDLATIMEAAMNPDNAPDYMASPHIKAKLEYFSQVIRRDWDTADWPETTSWEEFLDWQGYK